MTISTTHYRIAHGSPSTVLSTSSRTSSGLTRMRRRRCGDGARSIRGQHGVTPVSLVGARRAPSTRPATLFFRPDLSPWAKSGSHPALGIIGCEPHECRSSAAAAFALAVPSAIHHSWRVPAVDTPDIELASGESAVTIPRMPRIRAVGYDEVAALAGDRIGETNGVPACVRDRAEVLGFIVEDEGGPLAVAWSTCEAGRSTFTVGFAHTGGVDVSVMALLFATLHQTLVEHGARWLRWRLEVDELPLLDAIRKVAGRPALYRSASHFVAEVGATPSWRPV